MKKIFPLTLAVLLLFTSCSDSSPDQRLIKSGFNDYVNTNFDDPKSIQEIVSVVPADTASIQKVVDITKKALAESENTKQLRDSVSKAHSTMLNELIEKSKKNNIAEKIDEATLTKLAMLIMQNLNKLKEEQDLVIERYKIESQLKELVDNMQYVPPRYGYLIKFRQKQNGDLVLKEYYGYIDSLSREVKIRPNKWQVTDLNTSQQKFTALSGEYMTLLKQEFEIETAVHNNFEKFRSIIEKHIK